LNGIQEVGGSIPLSSTRKIKNLLGWRLSDRGKCYHFVTTAIGNRKVTLVKVAFLFSGEPDKVFDLPVALLCQNFRRWSKLQSAKPEIHVAALLWLESWRTSNILIRSNATRSHLAGQ
jgi:hypothetical protein